MGEIVELDVRQLRTVAARVNDAAGRIDEMPWPSLEPDALAGSEVAAATEPGPLPPRLAAAVAAMRGWAAAARAAASAFEDAERRSGGRFGR